VVELRSLLWSPLQAHRETVKSPDKLLQYRHVVGRDNAADHVSGGVQDQECRGFICLVPAVGRKGKNPGRLAIFNERMESAKKRQEDAEEEHKQLVLLQKK
jgi:hypothetical protein